MTKGNLVYIYNQRFNSNHFLFHLRALIEDSFNDDSDDFIKFFIIFKTTK